MDWDKAEDKIEKALKACCSEDDYRPAMCGIHNDGQYLVATDSHVLAIISLSEYPELKDIGRYTRNGPSDADYPDWEHVIPSTDNRTAEHIEISSLKTADDLISDAEQLCSFDLIQLNHRQFFQARYINKLVGVLEALEIGKAQLLQCPRESDGCLMIESEGVRLLVMPVNKEKTEQHNIVNKVVTRPVFEEVKS